MAKLTARFDVQDNMSRKLNTMRGNLDKLERSRDKINKPMTLRVRDRVTKHLSRINKATERATHSRTITMGIVDKISKPTEKINRYMQRKFPKSHSLMISVNDRATRKMHSINNFMKRRMPRAHEIMVRARDRSRSVLEGINRYLGRKLLGTHVFEIMARDRAMPTMHKIANYGRRALSKGYNFSVRAIDIATKTVGRISSFARTAIPKYRDFTIRAWDRATSVVSTVRRALFSIPTMITVGLAVVGLGSLNQATIGSAMNFEGYEVSMEHWLDGNTKQAEELVGWMGRFADSTPFSSVELFPALSRGIGVVDGDVDDAKQLLTIASNMAALTPSRTVEDAMEALASAQMGEFELLKGYNMKITADDYEDMGWSGFLDLMDDTFDDGARKFSETASGQLATLRGYASSIMREAGVGILESMKPRLDGITAWIDNNQDTWGRWKDAVQQAGEDASEWVFSKLENGFSHLRDNYLENDEFKNLDFEGKVSFIMDDLGQWWDKTGRPLLADVSKGVGSAIFTGVTWGIKEGLKGIGSMWLEAFKDPSVENFAGAGVATAIAGSILSLVLTPLFKGISGIFKTGKWFWDQGKKVGGLFGLGKDKSPKSGGGKGGGLFGRNRTPDYRYPWFGRGAKPNLNVPNAGKSSQPSIFERVKGGLGKFGKMAKIPVLGTALGTLSLATADKAEMPGILGGMGGGIAGASAGAALGSIVPGIGTAIGGMIGGIAGSFGGEKAVSSLAKVDFSKLMSWRPGYQQAEDGSWVSPEFYGGEPVVYDVVVEGLEKAKESISDTVFNGSWWSEKWEDTKSLTSRAWENTTDLWGKATKPIADTLFNGSWWSEKWQGTKDWASEKWEDAKDVWSNVLDSALDTIFSANWWAEQAGFVFGYLEETLFSGEWWSGHWETIKEITEGTIFDGEWWSEKWDVVKEWTQEKWNAFSEVWNSVKTSLSETIFSSEWWGGKWDSVKEWTTEKLELIAGAFVFVKDKISETIFSSEWWGEKWQSVKDWTSEKWETFTDVWDNAVATISNTIFSGEWWGEKWQGVKDWTSEKWETFTEVWSDAVDAINDTVFSSEWWEGHWDDVKGWTSERWEGFQEVWDTARDKISETIFNEEWWSGKWDTVKGWASTAWDGIKGMVSDLGDSFNEGRNEGRKAANNDSTSSSHSNPLVRRRVRPYADGGFINRPHLGLVGEAGPEAIIPLSSSRRSRAMSLYEQTGRMLGIQPYADGGVVGRISNVGSSASSMNTAMQLQGMIHSINNIPVELGVSTKSLTSTLLEVKDAIANGISTTRELINNGVSSTRNVVSSHSSGLGERINSSKESINNNISGLKGYLSDKISKVDRKAELALQTANSTNKSSGSSVSSIEDRVNKLIEKGGSAAKRYFEDVKSQGEWLSDNALDIGGGTNKELKPYWLAGHEYAKSLGFREGKYAQKHLSRIKGYAKGTKGPLSRSEVAWVGEQGPELVSLPKGAEVFTNQESKSMVRGGSNLGNIEEQGHLVGESFASSVGEGINNKVVSLDDWNQQNIQQPMNSVVQEAVGFGTSTVSSFASGQNATPTNTNAFLDRQVKTPFRVIEGGAPAWGTGTITGFRSGQDSTSTGTDSYLRTNVWRPFEETKAKGSAWGTGTISEFVSGMRSKGAQVVEAAKYLAEQVEKTFREELGIQSPSRVMYKLAQFVPVGIIKGISSVDIKGFMEKQIESMVSAFDGMGSGGGNVQKWLMAAMMATGAPGSWLAPLTTIAMKESGGRTGPGTINKWDSNWARGTPSMGLMQTIMPTFQAFKAKGMDNIMNPIHNAAAAINYIKSRYGTPFNTPGIRSMASGGPYKGYWRGTNNPLRSNETAWVGERGPELLHLPRGAEISSHRDSLDLINQQVPEDHLASVVSPKRSGKKSKGKPQSVVVQINGDNYYHNDMDAEKVAAIALDAIEKKLKDEYNEGGEMAVYD